MEDGLNGGINGGWRWLIAFLEGKGFVNRK